MNYKTAIEKIHEFEKFGSILGLERMTILMDLLGNPQDKLRIIHVAGTNGKGSVCRYLYSILQEGGYKVGLYTSPYIERFTERIEYDGKEISQVDLSKYTEIVLDKVNLMVRNGQESPTEFEVITAIGFCYFADSGADFLVLEVGLGGRGDSTNIVKSPILSIITSISFDHTEYLGDSLVEIATEKAGIIKHGVPVIANIDDLPSNEKVEQIAKEKNSPFISTRDIKPSNIEKSIKHYKFDVEILGEKFENIQLSMIGMHQIRNAICALTGIMLLADNNIITIGKQQVYNGFRKAVQNGRLEIIALNPYFIIDGAHNEAGARALQSVILEHFKNKRVLLVIGMLKDKKMEAILDALVPLADFVVASEPDNPRKLDANILLQAISKYGKKGISIPDIYKAVDFCKKNKNEYDLILCAGSLYLIGRVRGVIKDEGK
ncbi:MAG: folylpolyglutamate synthase/dihydrofolate synthase family protein [Eubacteriales bacterium]